MFRHYLLTLYRALTKHHLYAALNILGLAVGIAVFLVLALYVRFETSYERWIPGAPSIYVVRSFWNLAGEVIPPDSDTMGGLLDQLHGDYPQLAGTRLWDNRVTVRQGSQVTSEQVELVDPSFFKVFDLPMAAGDKASLLHRPDDLLVSQTLARKYFGSANPIGQRLTIQDQGVLYDYRVTGVMKDAPKNTDLKFDLVAPITPQMVARQTRWTHWGSQQVMTFLRFDTPDAAAAMNNDFDRFTDRHGKGDLDDPPHKTLGLRAAPLTALHLIDPKDAVVVATIGAVGLLTLLLAGGNYVNLATARAGLRAREVALRKVMGATGLSLVGQFMAESLVTATVAALIGLALCELTLPLINTAGGLALKIDYLGADGVLPMLIAVTAIVGLGAGAYPALVLSRFRPAAVLASARTPGGGRSGARVREGLVIFQFAIAIAFTIATGVIVSQSRYLKHADLGFARNGLIVVTNFDDDGLTAAQRSSILTVWRALPGVTGATVSISTPGTTHTTNGSNFTLPGDKGHGLSLNWEVVGPDFLQTYGARMAAGRPLGAAYGLDEYKTKDTSAPTDAAAAVPPANPPPVPASDATRNIMLNVNAVKVLGFASPAAAVGKIVREGGGSGAKPFRVVGVVENIRFRSPREALEPTVYFYTAQDINSGLAAVRYGQTNPKRLLDSMRGAWRQVSPTVPFEAKTVEDNLEPYYKGNDERGRLFTIGAALAVGIGCLGLYGLASFNTARRVKEIGIRKTLGASTGDIMRLLIGQFLRPVLIANLIAWPLAWVAMQNWLSGFDQRIGLNPIYFIGATALTLLIAVGTVAGQAYAVARSEPAKALRDE